MSTYDYRLECPSTTVLGELAALGRARMMSILHRELRETYDAIVHGHFELIGRHNALGRLHRVVCGCEW